MDNMTLIINKKGYALIFDKDEDDFEILEDFEIITGNMKGKVHNYYPNNIYGLFGAIDEFRYLTEDNYIMYERLEELATLFKDGLISDDRESAMEYFNETCEMSKEEKKYFGIKEVDEDE